MNKLLKNVTDMILFKRRNRNTKDKNICLLYSRMFILYRKIKELSYENN